MRIPLFVRTVGLALTGALASTALAANDGVNDPAEFPEVDIFIVVAKRSAVANDDANKAAHLEGLAQAERAGTELTIREPEGGDSDTDGDGENDEDGFITLTQNNPGKSGANGKNPDVPTGHLSNMVLTLVNNTFEGEGVFIFDSDGDGSVVANDNDGDDEVDDENGDGFDDGDQVVPVRVRVGQRSNAKTDFLQGTLHNSLDDAGSIGGEAAESTDQPRINGRIRSSRHAAE